MIWNDIYMSQRPMIPKWFCFIASCICFIMACCAVYSSIIKIELIEKIIPAMAFPFFIYYSLGGFLATTKGDEYVEKIEKKGDYFILTNIFDKQINFTVSDVHSVGTAKFSLTELIFTGHKYTPGLDLILTNGRKYYITYHMENMDTLKEHLLGRVK